MTVLVVGVPLAVCAVLPFTALDLGAWEGDQRSLARIALLVGPPLAAATAGLAITGLLIATWLRGKAENRLQAQQALANAAGGLPGVDPAADQAEVERRARSMRWQLPLVLAGFPFVAWAVFSAARLLKSRWPEVPAWALYAGILTPLAVAGAALLFLAGRRRSARSSPHVGSLWAPARWIIYFAIFLFVGSYLPLGWIDRIVPGGVLSSLVKVALLIILFSVIVSARNILTILLAQAGWHSGEYDRVLARIRFLSFGRPTAKMREIEGVTHALAARPAEAERCFREALARNHDASRSERTTLMGCLAETLADQGRYEEARWCAQAAVDMGDNVLGSNRVGLAEMLLRQGIEPQRALDLVDDAMRVAKGRVGRRVERARWAYRAWALALLGRRQEAELAIGRACQDTSETYRALLANTQWSVGMALLAMEQPGRAIEHFRAARELEPNGKYGALASRQLDRDGA